MIMKRPPEPPFSLELPLLSERQNGRQMLNTPEVFQHIHPVSYTHLDVYKRQALISDLNSRGHSKLTLREDGDICIEQGEDAVSQEHLNNFPQKVYWPRLAEVLELSLIHI